MQRIASLYFGQNCLRKSERINPYFRQFLLTHKILKVTLSQNTRLSSCTAESGFLTTLRKEAFKNIVGKGEKTGHKYCLIFPECFLHIENSIFLLSYGEIAV